MMAWEAGWVDQGTWDDRACDANINLGQPIQPLCHVKAMTQRDYYYYYDDY